METLLFFWLLLAANGVVTSQPGPNHKGSLTRYPNLANADLKTDENWESVDGELDYPRESIEDAKAPKEVADWLRKEVNHVRNRRSTESEEYEFQERICDVRIDSDLPKVENGSINSEDFKLGPRPVNLTDDQLKVRRVVCRQNNSTASPLDETNHRCKQEYVHVPLISVVTNGSVVTNDLVVRFQSWPYGCTCLLTEN